METFTQTESLKQVHEELNIYFKDFKLGIDRAFKYQKIKTTKEYFKDKKGCSKFFSCCWGTIYFNDKNYCKLEFEKKIVKEKTGIEILISIYDKRMLGKCFTIKELKLKCKENKLKGYSKLDKLKLIGLLMTI